jgi:ATP-dependent Clp protease ATP-binding subunit ClpA
VGYEEGGQMTERVRRTPYSVILLDEIEKAHPDLFNILLQVFEDGQLTDGLGNTVDFRNTIIIMTSNLGARHLQKRTSIGFQSGVDEAGLKSMEDLVMGEVKRSFNPEFLNRLDEVIMFNPLGDVCGPQLRGAAAATGSAEVCRRPAVRGTHSGWHSKAGDAANIRRGGSSRFPAGC